MIDPSITVITVNYNDVVGLKSTIESVIKQNHPNFDYLIVDGQSTDGSIELINSYERGIFRSLIETDKGIYHAMNKAISMATGDWVIFMNSGDIFADSTSLKSAMENIHDSDDIIFADWIYAKSGQYIKASKSKMAFRHQSIIYRRSLHDKYGTYVVSPGVTISDYIFFCSVENVSWRYKDMPLSICEETGVSSKVSHFYQRVSVDFIFGRCGKTRLLLILLLYPYYKFFKTLFIVNDITKGL